MQNRVNSFTGFDPLKEVWLGDVYPAHFYSHLSTEIQDAFGLITEWTQHDLRKIQQTLESAGVLVQRPEFTDNVGDYILNDQLLKPPICPRDDNMTLGNEFYHLRSQRYKINPWKKQIQDFKNNNVVIHSQVDSAVECIVTPSVVRMGRDIYIDYESHQHVWGMITEVLVEWSKHYRVHVCNTNGHSDGVFCPVAPGTIVATHYLKEYSKTFPDWQVFQLPAPDRRSWRGSRISHWSGQWHIEDKAVMENIGFANHINQYAVDWIGNYKETVFEANMLVINPKHVLAIKEEPQMFKWLNQQGIEVTYCDFRCRSFWDGGLHCLTTDIVRNSECKDYFPQRPEFNYMDWLC